MNSAETTEREEATSLSEKSRADIAPNGDADVAGETKPSAAPADEAGWRALILSLPARDLLRVVQKDAIRNARILSGFRPANARLHSPPILGRLAEESVRKPDFAKAVLELRDAAAAIVSLPGESAAEMSRAKVSAPSTPTPPDSSAAPEDRRLLREQVNRQRAQILEKEAKLKTLEGALAQAERDRETAQVALRQSSVERARLADELERVRRREDRDTKRAAAKSEEATAAAARAKPVSAASRDATVFKPAAASPAPDNALWFVALERVLQHGKFAAVAAVCREALQITELPTASRGALCAFYARALAATNNTEQAVEQDRQATLFLLDSGQIGAAAAAFFRVLEATVGQTGAQTDTTKIAARDTPTLQRLLLLAERMGQLEPVRREAVRLRVQSPSAYRALETTLFFGGKRYDALREALTQTPRRAVGPDDVIALPTTQGSAASITARRVVLAVEAGDVSTVFGVREGLATLRNGDAQLAETFVEVIAALSVAAVYPITGPSRPVVVDASNVARHDPDPLSDANEPRAVHLLRMRDVLLMRGYFPILLIADANLRYVVADRVLYEDLVARAVVREVNGGVSADMLLIREAHERNVPLVTNDHLSEWGEEAQSIERIGFRFLAGGRVVLFSDG